MFLSKTLQEKFAIPKEHTSAMEMLLLLFFCWGMLLSLNDVLSVAMRSRLQLTYHTALLLQFSYFLVCFLSAPLVGRLLERHGYRRNIIAGLCLMSGGCTLMAVSVLVASWAACLGSSAVIGFGINLMQTAAAPMMTHLGDPDAGSRRFAFALGFNSLGTTAGPLLASRWLAARSQPMTVIGYYGGLAVALLLLMYLTRQLPRIRLPEERAAEITASRARWADLLGRPALLLGACAMFLYVGAEIGLGSLLAPFEIETGIPAATAARMLSLYWGGATLGRFLLVPLLRKPRDLAVLAAVASCAAILVCTASLYQDRRAAWALLPVGLCNAVMVPVLYDRSLAGLGGLTARGAAVMSAMGIGGALLPQLLGWVSDRRSVHQAFLLLLVPYLAILTYAVSYRRLRKPKNACES